MGRRRSRAPVAKVKNASLVRSADTGTVAEEGQRHGADTVNGGGQLTRGVRTPDLLLST